VKAKGEKKARKKRGKDVSKEFREPSYLWISLCNQVTNTEATTRKPAKEGGGRKKGRGCPQPPYSLASSSSGGGGNIP